MTAKVILKHFPSEIEKKHLSQKTRQHCFHTGICLREYGEKFENFILLLY